MKKTILGIGLFFMAISSGLSQTTIPVYKIGIFAPLFLDSLFNTGGAYKYGKEIPKFAMPGLEFVQGAQTALDSMHLFDENLQANVYDTRSYSRPLATLIRMGKLDSLQLIVGSVRDADYRTLADFAMRKHIPFVSATYPNDGGITGNPFTIIMSSTLRAHCEGIFSYAVQNHGMDNILLLRKKGEQEDRVTGYFKAINEPDGKPLLNIKTLYIDSTFSAAKLQQKLDSTHSNIIIGGSLDETFAVTLADAANEMHEKYSITLIGMPNWDGFRSLQRKGSYEEFPIYYTTPYYNSKWDNYSKILINSYNKKYKNRPTDMAFKGFESVYLFTKLLVKHPNDLMSNLNDKTFKVFCEYNFRPVVKKGAATPDYIENKHVYFMKLLNGVTSKAW